MTGRPARSPRSNPAGKKRSSCRVLKASATRVCVQPRDARNRTNSTTAANTPSTVAGERVGASETTLGSGALRRLRPRRCLREGVRSSQRANAASCSGPGDVSSTPAPADHVR